MKQNVYTYVQYVIVNNTNDNQSFKEGGGNNNILKIYIYKIFNDFKTLKLI